MKMKNIESSLEDYRERTEYLKGFLTPERIETLERVLSMRTLYMTILTENIYHPQNASALVRHCEAFGVQSMHTVETRCKFIPNLSIVRGTDKWIDINPHDSTTQALNSLKADGYRIVATTPHRESCTPESFDVTKGKFALVFGTEHAGISDEVMESADEYLRIPMCGMVESLNVSASAAILIYQLSERMRQQVPCELWRLSEEEYIRRMYRWSYLSVRDAQGILERKYGLDNQLL